MSDGKPAPQNIQDAFLNTVRRDKATVTVYLVNGAKLLGKIRSFDKFSVLLESGCAGTIDLQTRHLHHLTCQTLHRRVTRLRRDAGRSYGKLRLAPAVTFV